MIFDWLVNFVIDELIDSGRYLRPWSRILGDPKPSREGAGCPQLPRGRGIWLPATLLGYGWDWPKYRWDEKGLFIIHNLISSTTVRRGKEAQPQQILVRATFSLFSRQSHLEILILAELFFLNLQIKMCFENLATLGHKTVQITWLCNMNYFK